VDEELLQVKVAEKHEVVESNGHGHGHSHGAPPGDGLSSLVWMVIMGDGFHNFCDGVAIGMSSTYLLYVCMFNCD